MLTEVGSYGKQLGRIEDALMVLIRHFQLTVTVSAEQRPALDALTSMVDEVADIKRHHGRQALRE